MPEFEVGTPIELPISMEISGLMSASMLGNLQEGSGERGIPPFNCIVHWASICCCCLKACCFSALSRLYIGPNLFLPPRILSDLTAENGS